jgi:hypothetical protein
VPCCILLAAIVLLNGTMRSTRAQEPGAQKKADEGETKKQPAGAAKDRGFDPAVVSSGMAAFQRDCTTCHDAARALERTKDLAGWRATVQRMAARRGADIPAGDIEPIAVYLASRNVPAGGAGDAGKDKDGASTTASTPPPAATSSMSSFVTISPLWRGGNDQLQNSGFAPLAWVGASWQGKIVSARVTVCVACHGVQEATFLSRVDIVEAAARVDLSSYLESCLPGWKAAIDAGRFVVPFGAFAAQTNPGVYRTVSTPLIFNMGQRIFNQDLGVPVLPMPYADEGINFSFDVPVYNCEATRITATLDAYLVNGLAGSAGGIDFLQSRDLIDNNNRVAGGGRVTLGNSNVRIGASLTGGRFDDPRDPAVPNGPLNYRIFGVDLQARYKRLLRFQIEYARRDTDRVLASPAGPTSIAEEVDGYYMEIEARPWDDCHVSLLARHDILNRNSALPPLGSTLTTGTYCIERFTLGLNIELWHQSLLMFNLERWFVPEPQRAVNVYGVRYAITF